MPMRMTPEPARRHLRSRFLVDLALHRDGLREMFEAEPSACHDLLYRQTDQAAVADAGPLLIEPTSSDAQSLCRQWVERGLAMEMRSARSFADVARHLQTLTMVAREQAPPALFRYADPRLYAGLCPALGEHERVRLLGPNETLTGVAAGVPWTLCQSAEVAERYEPPRENFRLTQRHRESIQVWRIQVLIQAQFDVSPERLSGWLRQLCAMGFESEQACLEGCWCLASLGLSRPIDESHCMAVQALDASWQAKLAALKRRLMDEHVAYEEPR